MCPKRKTVKARKLKICCFILFDRVKGLPLSGRWIIRDSSFPAWCSRYAWRCWLRALPCWFHELGCGRLHLDFYWFHRSLWTCETIRLGRWIWVCFSQARFQCKDPSSLGFRLGRVGLERCWTWLNSSWLDKLSQDLFCLFQIRQRSNIETSISSPSLKETQAVVFMTSRMRTVSPL